MMIPSSSLSTASLRFTGSYANTHPLTELSGIGTDSASSSQPPSTTSNRKIAKRAGLALAALLSLFPVACGPNVGKLKDAELNTIPVVNVEQRTDFILAAINDADAKVQEWALGKVKDTSLPYQQKTLIALNALRDESSKVVSAGEILAQSILEDTATQNDSQTRTLLQSVLDNRPRTKVTTEFEYHWGFNPANEMKYEYFFGPVTKTYHLGNSEKYDQAVRQLTQQCFKDLASLNIQG